MKETRWDKAITYREVAREESDWMTNFAMDKLKDLFKLETFSVKERYSRSYREDGVLIEVEYCKVDDAATATFSKQNFFAEFQYWFDTEELQPIQFDSQARDFQFKYSYDEVENISEEIITILEDREVEVGEVRFQYYSKYENLQ